MPLAMWVCFGYLVSLVPRPSMFLTGYKDSFWLLFRWNRMYWKPFTNLRGISPVVVCTKRLTNAADIPGRFWGVDTTGPTVTAMLGENVACVHMYMYVRCVHTCMHAHTDTVHITLYSSIKLNFLHWVYYQISRKSYMYLGHLSRP